MKKSFKVLALILALAMCVFAFTACSSQKKAEDAADQAQEAVDEAVDDASAAVDEAADAAADAAASVAGGEICDTGAFSVMVPDGWKAFPQSEPGKLKVYKGATSEDDMYGKPGIDITYSASGSYYLVTGVFDSYEEVAGVTIGDREWSGAEGAYSSSMNLTSLSAVDGEGYFAVDIWQPTDGNTISPDDADVIAIITSLTADAAE
ncbi:MAG: hypothetical protein IJG50_09200 [Clostridia bacterium]|nr:hypothetical protein [Clostridia bacterium]